LKAGGGYLPIDPDLPHERQRLMLDRSRTQFIVTTSELRAGLPDHAGELIVLDQTAKAIESGPDTNPGLSLTPDDLAYITFTSGSTGTPKGSLIPHRSVSGFFENVGYMELTPKDVVLQHSSILWDALTLELWPALLSGASVALMTVLHPTTGEVADAVVDHQVTTLWLAVSLFNVLIDESPSALRSVRQLLIGGESPSPSHVRRAQELLPNTRLVNGYGPSECTVFSTCYPIPPLSATPRSLPIGRPVGDRIVHILDANMAKVPVGVPGEIFIGGPAVAHGYLGEPALTAAKFVPDPFGVPGGRLYRSGDYARYQPSGLIEIVGRRDGQIKLRGIRIELGEIEAQIKSHPAVRDAVCELRDEAQGRRIVAYVVPQAGVDESSAAGQVESWLRVFDERVYAGEADPVDPLFNVTGWKSSYDGSQIPLAEMREWARDITSQVRALKPKRILEIGCGTGMLLLDLARDTEGYIGTDISKAALDYVRRQLAGNPSTYRRVQLEQQPADDFSGIPAGSVDVVLLSSVVQYFPSIDYLMKVLQGCVTALRPGGSIVLADLRNHALARAFHASIQAFVSPDDTPIDSFKTGVEQRLQQETELFVDPAFFGALAAHQASTVDVRIRLQRGRVHNELTRFRYTAIVTVGGAVANEAVKPVKGLHSLHDIEALLQGRPERLLVTELPNARLMPDLRLQEMIAKAGPTATLGTVRRLVSADGESIDPEDVAELAARYGYAVEIGWSEHRADRFDAAFTASGATTAALLPIAASRPIHRAWQSYANAPRQVEAAALAPILRRFLAERLPDSMVPSAFVLLDRLPLTANGKLDRKALPAPGVVRQGMGAAYIAPRNALEKVLAGFYSELLGVDPVGVDDNFFDHGGHSLLVTQLASRVRKTFKLDLPLRLLFEEPTVGRLARLILERDGGRQAERIAALYLQVATLTPEEVERQVEQRGKQARA
jgi:amino acid adenylation domain-containing protein